MKKFLSVLLSIMMVLSTVSFALPGAVTVFDNAQDFVNAAYAEQDTASLADDVWTDPGKGIKLFVIDLDGDTGYVTNASKLSNLNNRIDGTNDNRDSNGMLVSELGRINPDVDATEASTFKISFKDGGTPTVEGTDDKYFKISSGQPSVMLANIDIGAGTYTYEFTYKTNTAVYGVHNDGCTILGGTLTQTAIDSTWSQLSYVVDSTEESWIRFRPTTAGSDNWCIDDIVVYYKPDGWGEEDKEPVADEWIHNEYGELVFNIDFEKNNAGNAVASSVVSGMQSTSQNVPVTNVGRVNPKYSTNASEWAMFFRDVNSGTVTLGTDAERGSYLQANGARADVSLYIEGVTNSGRDNFNNPFITEPGTYTLVYDYRVDTASLTLNPRFNTYSAATLTGEVNKWATCTFTCPEDMALSCLRLRSAGAVVGDTHYYDNIRLYYKPEGWTPPSEGGDDETDSEWKHETYGTKLFSLNFDTKNDGTKVTESDLSGIDSGRLDQDLSAGILVSKVGCVNPSLPVSQTGDYRVSVKDLSAFGLGTEGDRQYLYFKSTTEKPCLMLGGFNDKDGDYTIVFSYKYKANGTGFAHDRLYMHTHNLNVDKNYLSNETWVTAPYSFCTTDGDAFKKNFMRCVFYSSGHVFTGVEEFMIDEIAVYYKSKDYVSVTLDANGASGMSNVTVSDVPAEGITVAELLARISNKSGRQLLGLSKTADGTALPVGEKIVANDGDKLYMIWGNTLVDKTITWTDSEKGYLLFDIDFETDKQYVRHADKLNTLGNVNTNIVNNDVWFLSLNYYQDVIPGSGDASYEPVEADIKYELVDGKYNKYLSVKPDGSNRWPQLGIMAYSSATSNNYLVFGGANGIYTIEYDLRAVIAEDSNYKYTSTVVDLATYDASTGTYPTKTQGDSVSTGTLKNGTWEHLSGSLNNTDYDGLTRIKPCNQYPENPVSTGDEFHFDNFKLYWKPFEVSVTIDNSANPYADNVSLKIPTDKTMTAGELKAYVKSTGLMQLKGFAKTPGGIILADSTPIDFFGNLTYYAVWEEKDMTGWTDKDYGVLIYELDFDNASAFTDCSNASSYGRVNTNLAGSDAWTVSANGYNAVAVGDKALQLTVGDSSRNPEFTVSAQTANEKLFASGGVYTVVYDAKLVSADNFATNTNFSAMSAVAKAGTNNDGSWTFRNLRSDIKVNDTAALSEWATYVGTVDSSNYDGLSDFSVRLTYSSTNPVSDKETLFIDNVRLFWRPDKVMLTVDPGENKVAEKKSFPISTSGVSVSEITSKIVDHGDMKLRGISLTKNGEPLTGTINTASDITVYALWDELGEVITEYSIEFEYDESSGNDIIWSNQGTNVNKGTGNGFARHKDGYGIFTFNAAKEHSAVWDANIQFTPFVNGNILAGTVKGVMIRARFKNIPRFDCACAESVDKHVHEYKSGSSNTYNNANQMFQMYYATTETKSLNETQSLKFNFSLAEGSPYCDGWFTLYADVSDKDDFQNKIIDYVRLDFNNDVWDGTEIDIDYVRFIGDVSMAPETQQTSSMRTDKPTGIRFMASLEKEIVAESTSYGWIIARASSIKSASLKNSEFTYEAALEKNIPTLRGCNYGEGRQQALNYSEDDVNVYFTALLYNIPDTMYKDVLVARPFAVVGDTTYYGAPVSRSVYDVAKSIKDGGFRGCTAAQQTYIQRVIDKVENA